MQIIRYSPTEPVRYTVLNEPKRLRDIFNIPESFSVKAHYRFSKKEGGFNPLASLKYSFLNDIIIIVNNSQIPEGYKHYPLSEDQSDHGNPWIQMYQFRPGMAMMLTTVMYDRLSLTPIKLFCEDATDCDSEQSRSIKHETHLDLYVFRERH